jgi:hypothetical protein
VTIILLLVQFALDGKCPSISEPRSDSDRVSRGTE